MSGLKEGSIRSLINFLETLEQSTQREEEESHECKKKISAGSKAYATLVELNAYELRINLLVNDLDVLHTLYLKRTQDLKMILGLPEELDVFYSKDSLGSYHILGKKK